jgi:hypothetical protein
MYSLFVKGFEAMVANEMLGLAFDGAPFATGEAVLAHVGVSSDAVSIGIERQLLLITINYGLAYGALLGGQPQFVDLSLPAEDFK